MSMKSSLEQLEEATKNANDEVMAKIAALGSSELAAFGWNWHGIKSADDFRQSRDAFLKQFDDFNPMYRPHYYFNDIENSIKKEIGLRSSQRIDLIEIFRKHIKQLKERRGLVTQRISTPSNLKKFKLEFENFTRNLSQALYESETALLSLQSSNEIQLNFQELMIALKFEFGRELREFPLKAFHRALKLFPLAKRREVLEIALGRLVSDVKDSLKPMSQYPTNEDELTFELERLSKVLGVPMDLSGNDGQRFFYLCDKIFTETFRTEMAIPQFKQIELTDDYATQRKILDVEMVKRCPKDRLVESMIDQFSVFSIEDMTTILSIVSARRLEANHLSRDRTTAMLKLEFVRNRTLFGNCVQKVRQLFEARKKICPDNSDDYFEVTMSWIKAYALSVLSKSFGSISETVNKERVFEEFMFDMFEYLSAKLDIVQSLNTILQHSSNDTIVKLSLNVIDQFPMVMFSPMFAFQYPFRIAVEELKVQACAIQTLIEMHSIHETKMANELQDSFFNLIEQETPFHVFPALSLIVKIIDRVPQVALEIAETFGLKWIKMETYMKWAVWTQLMNEFRAFRDNSLFPYDFLALGSFSGVSDQVRDFFVCPYLNNWNDLVELVSSEQEDKRCGVVLSTLKFLHFANKLKRYLYTTRCLLLIYCQQRRMSPLNVEPMSDVLEFVNSYESFRDMDGVADFDKLRKVVDAQRRLNVMFSVAVRFNNFYCDANFLSSQFGITEDFVPYQAITAAQFEDDLSIRKFAVSQVVNCIDKVNESGLSRLFCNIRDITDCSNIQKIRCAVLPFAYRIELAMICRMEAALVSSVSSNHDFVVDSGSNFVTDDGQVVPSVIPGTFYCLSIEKPGEVFEPLIKFVAARLNLICLLRLESIAGLRFAKVIDGISSENVPCDFGSLMAMNKEIVGDKGFNDVNLVALLYSEREEYIVNRLVRACLAVIDDVYDSTDQKKKRRFKESNSEQSLKRWWKSLNKAFWSHSKACTSRRYYPDVYEQMLFQCDDFTRAEVEGEFQNQDGIVKDALRNVELEDANRAKCDFMNALVKCSLMKRVFILMYSESNAEELNVLNSVLNVTEEMWKQGELIHHNQIEVQATQRLGSNSEKVSVEMKHQSELHRAYLRAIDAFLCDFQLERFKSSLSTVFSDLSDAITAPNAMLKPELYKRAAKGTNMNREVYAPAPKDSDKQFGQELQFAMARIIYSVKEKVDLVAGNSGCCQREALVDMLSESSALIEWIGKKSSENAFATWHSYLDHASKQFDNTIDEQVLLRMFVQDLYSNLESQISYEMGKRMKEDFFKLNTLRYLERVMKASQRREELQMTKAVKGDFEELIADLKQDITSTKAEYHKAHNAWYGTAINQVAALQKEPEELKEILSRKRLRTHEEKVAKVQKEQDELRTQILKMRTSRCLERIGSTVYYTRQIAKVGEEKKSLSATLWSAKREFEEEQRLLTQEVQDGFRKLTDAELEIENLTQKLEQEKHHTEQLMHWRGMSLKSYSLMVEEEKALDKVTGDVNVSQLLARLAAAHDELDQLVAETDAFDEEFTFEVREPMAERDRRYRRLVHISAQNAADAGRLRELTQNTAKESPFLERMITENAALQAENEELRNKIFELEQAKSEMTPSVRQSLDGLFDPAPKPPPFPRRTIAFSTNPHRIIKPTQNPASARRPVPKIVI